MMAAIVISISLAGIIAYFWAKAIDNQMDKWPDYKGEDFLN